MKSYFTPPFGVADENIEKNRFKMFVSPFLWESSEKAAVGWSGTFWAVGEGSSSSRESWKRQRKTLKVRIN